MMHHLSRAPRNNHFSRENQGQYGADICSIDLPPKPTSMNLFSFPCSCVVHDRMIRLAFHLAWSILHPFELTAAWLVRCSADYFDCCYTDQKENRVSVSCVYPGCILGVSWVVGYRSTTWQWCWRINTRKRIPYPLHRHIGRDLWNRSNYPIASSTKTDAAEKIIIINIIKPRPRRRDKRSVVGRLRRSPRIY